MLRMFRVYGRFSFLATTLLEQDLNKICSIGVTINNRII